MTYTLMGPTVTGSAQDPLAVHYPNNRPFTTQILNIGQATYWNCHCFLIFSCQVIKTITAQTAFKGQFHKSNLCQSQAHNHFSLLCFINSEGPKTMPSG